MTDKLLEKYMVEAFKYINDAQNEIIDKDETVTRSLKAIAASFCPAVRETGLLSTLVSYRSKTTTNKEYGQMLTMIWALYKNVTHYAGICTDARSYAIQIVGEATACKKFKRELECAGVAIKLTLRSYSERKTNNA